jgi:hypothetical protein
MWTAAAAGNYLHATRWLCFQAMLMPLLCTSAVPSGGGCPQQGYAGAGRLQDQLHGELGVVLQQVS